ncbi:MAG: MFS transporter [Planctomycetota bacterium]|nr:MFS transporter [Planctomycetota bacterium]
MPRISVPVRNALAYAVPELFWGTTWALTVDGPMVAAFSDDFGGSQGFVGMAWLLGSFGLGVPLLLSGFWVEPMRRKRGLIFWGHIAGGVAMLVVAALVHLAADPLAARIAFLGGTTLFFIGVGFLIPGWLACVGELFSASTQARVLGITFLANKLAAVFAGQFIAQQVLDAPWTATDQWTLLFGIAGAAGVIGSFPFLWIVETPRERRKHGSLVAYLRSLLDALRELPALRRFVFADALGITVLLTLGFYADAAIRGEGFSNSIAGHWVAVSAVAMLLASGLIALVGERLRPRYWMIIGLVVGAVASLAAARGGSTFAYEVAAAGVGVYLATRASCHAPQVMRLAPGRDGTAPIGIALALVMPVQGLGPWIAGEHLIPSTGYAPVFAVVAGLAVTSAILLLLWVPRSVSRGAPGGGGAQPPA